MSAAPWRVERIAVTCRSQAEALSKAKKAAPASDPKIVGMRFCMEDRSGLTTFTVRLDAAPARQP